MGGCWRFEDQINQLERDKSLMCYTSPFCAIISNRLQGFPWNHPLVIKSISTYTAPILCKIKRAPFFFLPPTAKITQSDRKRKKTMLPSQHVSARFPQSIFRLEGGGTCFFQAQGPDKRVCVCVGGGGQETRRWQYYCCYIGRHRDNRSHKAFLHFLVCTCQNKCGMKQTASVQLSKKINTI